MRSTAGCLILIVLLGASMSKAAIEIKFADMSDDMQKEAQHALLLAQLIYKENNEIANFISKDFDRKHGGTWNAIVGNFGSHITSSSYICFYDGSKFILLFKH